MSVKVTDFSYSCLSGVLRRMCPLVGVFVVHQIMGSGDLASHQTGPKFVLTDSTIYFAGQYNVGIDACRIPFLVDGHRHFLSRYWRVFLTVHFIFRRKVRGDLLQTSSSSC